MNCQFGSVLHSSSVQSFIYGSVLQLHQRLLLVLLAICNIQGIKWSWNLLKFSVIRVHLITRDVYSSNSSFEIPLRSKTFLCFYQSDFSNIDQTILNILLRNSLPSKRKEHEYMKVLNLCLYLLLQLGKKRHEITITSSFYLLFDLNMCNYNKKNNSMNKKRLYTFFVNKYLKALLKNRRSCDFLLIFEIHDFDSSIPR